MTALARRDTFPEFADLRVLIAHDWLVAWAGSERCVQQMLEVFPNADLVVGVRSTSVKDLNTVTRRARETWLGLIPGARTHHRWFLPLEPLAFATVDTRGYDLVISSSHAFSKSVRRSRTAVHVCYCYSPPRYLWDLAATYRRHGTPPERVALGVASWPLRWLDRWLATRVDHFIGISHYVADRVKRCYGREADVVYPPVQLKPAKTPGRDREDFLLTLGRLVPYKRVDLAIAVAERLGVHLVVAGDGPDRTRLETLAGRHSTFLGEVSETEAGDLLSRCRAFVFCAEDDFGIAPVEANAHGAPVVAYSSGGATETIVGGVTGEFFASLDVEAIAAATRRVLERDWDVVALRENAARFAPEKFREGFARCVASALRRAGTRRDWVRPGQPVDVDG